MSAEIIDKAGQATYTIKCQYRELCQVVAALEPLTAYNAYGVLIDPGMLLAELDGVTRALRAMHQTIINTQWPKAADGGI